MGVRLLKLLIFSVIRLLSSPIEKCNMNRLTAVWPGAANGKYCLWQNPKGGEESSGRRSKYNFLLSQIPACTLGSQGEKVTAFI